MRYWVGGSGTWDASSTTHWSASSGGAGGASVPTSADDVVFDANSGTGTVVFGASTPCNSLNTIGSSVTTCTHNSGVIISIGSATPGPSNLALDLSGFTTYTLGNSVTSAFTFVSTSATQQTINFAGKTTGRVSFTGAGGSYKFTGGHTMPAAAADMLLHTRSALDLNGQTLNWGTYSSNNGNTRSLTGNGATINITGTFGGTPWDITNGSGMTMSMLTSTINFSSGAAAMQGGGKNYGTVNINNSGVFGIINVGGSFVNLNRNGTAAKTDGLRLDSNIIVSGVLGLAGNSDTNRLIVLSNTPGTRRTITNTGATMTWSNVDFTDIGLSTGFNAAAITGGSGDGGGNLNITFTTGISQAPTVSTTKNWSDASIWPTRVPLPQDITTGANITGGTLTADMPRLGRSISFVGATGNPTFAMNVLTNNIYGSLTLIPAMTFTHTAALVFAGDNTNTITMAGKSFGGGVSFTGGGSWTLQDAYTNTAGTTINLGGFFGNAQNITTSTFNSNNSNTRTVDINGSVLSLTSTAAGTIFNLTTTTGLTFSGSTASLVITQASANSRTIAGGGKDYGTVDYTVAGSTGALVFADALNMNTLNFSDASNARTLTFHSASTYRIANWNVNGTLGKAIVINASTAGNAAILDYTGSTLVSSNYLTIQDSTPVETNTWFAGQASTLVSNTGNWIVGTGNTKAFTASMGFVGVGPKQTNIPLSAGMTFVGEGIRGLLRDFAAALGFVGDAPKLTFHEETATLGLLGSINKFIGAPLTAALTFTGSLARGFFSYRTLTAALSFAGTMTRSKVYTRVFTAALGFTTGISRRFTRTLESTLFFSQDSDLGGGDGFGAGFGDVDFGSSYFGQGSSVTLPGVGTLVINYIKSKGLFFTGILTMIVRRRGTGKPAVAMTSNEAPHITIE